MEIHGGNIHKIKREKNIEILDYSSNINSYPVPESLKEEIMKKFNGVLSYPDPDYVELRELLAEYCKVKSEDITVGNGATELIFLYMKASSSKRVLILSPTFSEYERAVSLAGGEVCYFELKEEAGFKVDMIKLKKQIKEEKYDTVLICNPNNPTGVLTETDKLKEIYEVCEKQNTKLFIDEAFIEFTSKGFENSAINLGREYKNLFIVRAFTKFFAMPGIRLGYSICFNEELNQKMLKIKEPWSVNWFADTAGKFMVKEIEFITNSKRKIEEEKIYMKEELSKIENLKFYESDSNFILINLINGRSSEIQKKMVDRGILIRECKNFKYLNEKFIRVAIKERESNKRVLESLKTAVSEVKI